jgi:hypothetical protein
VSRLKNDVPPPLLPLVLDFQVFAKCQEVELKTAASSDNIMSSPNEAPSSVAGEYDPKSDHTRKSTDPGWKYGFWPDFQNKDKVECTLCGQVVSGGIKRLKQHLAGAYGDAKLCPKASSGLRKEMTSLRTR